MYFLIRPLKVEVASPEPHSILVIHNMISDEEADSLIEQVIVKDGLSICHKEVLFIAEYKPRAG